MNKRTIALLSLLSFMLAASIIFAASGRITLQRKESCKTVSWTENEPIFTQCTNEFQRRVCNDPPLNSSCRMENALRKYSCINGTEEITKTKQECSPDSIEISRELSTINQIIEFEGWGLCSIEQSNVVICDSKYDGNGDGKCTSGESCMKFIITHQGVEQYVRNSDDQFVLEDNSFFLQKLQVKEVGQ